MILVKRDDNVDVDGTLIIYSILLIIFGLLLVVRGFKVYRIAIMIISGIFFAQLAVFIALSIDQTLSNVVIWIIAIFAGILGAVIGYTFYKFCLFIVGALAGVYLGLVILSLKQPSLIESQGGRIALLAILGFIGAILVYKLEKIAVIGATSIIGSYLIMVAIDLYTHWGFKNTLELWKSGNFDHVQTNNIYFLVVGFVLVGIFGFAIQRRNLIK